MAVVLKLSEAFGGHRFGPFSSGAVHFGTDRGRCQIVLDASTGLAPCHAVFTIGPGLQFSIAPIDRSCAVYVIRSGTTRANQVMGATALGPNDSFTLGSINGARFFIESQQSTPLGQSRSSHARHPSQPGYATAFGQEVQRQMETRLLTKFPMYRVAHEYWYKYKTGVLSQPRNVIALVVMVLGFLGTGCIGCMGTLAALFQQFMP